MKHRWMVVYAGSLLVGLGVRPLAPGTWGFTISHALLLGSALYFGALHRYAGRWEATPELGPRPLGSGMWLGFVTRTFAFLAVAALQAMVCFEWAPGADVRVGFVVVSTWLAALGIIDAPPTRALRPESARLESSVPQR